MIRTILHHLLCFFPFGFTFCPETKWVEGRNYVDIGFKIDPRTNRIIMMGAIDNLVKGAAGQAVQNMNLMFGLPESEGLELVPMFP